MTRRAFLTTLGGAGVAGAVAGNAFAIEPRWLDVARHDTRSLAPESASSLTLALLADLHLQSVGPLERSVAEETRVAQPDLVVLAGDSVDERGRLGVLEDFLSLLPEAPPKVAILGNWEHWARVDLGALRDAYARHDVRLLDNEHVALRYGRRRVFVTGFDDATAGRPHLGALPQPPAKGFRLALAHSPTYRDRLAALPSDRWPDLVLSGHTHGGQLDLLGWRPFLPRGSGRYVEGWYARTSAASTGGPPLYVSRGIGTSVVPARLGAQPELTLLRV